MGIYESFPGIYIFLEFVRCYFKRLLLINLSLLQWRAEPYFTVMLSNSFTRYIYSSLVNKLVVVLCFVLIHLALVSFCSMFVILRFNLKTEKRRCAAWISVELISSCSQKSPYGMLLAHIYSASCLVIHANLVDTMFSVMLDS